MDVVKVLLSFSQISPFVFELSQGFWRGVKRPPPPVKRGLKYWSKLTLKSLVYPSKFNSGRCYMNGIKLKPVIVLMQTLVNCKLANVSWLLPTSAFLYW